MVFAGKKLFLYYSHYFPNRKRDKAYQSKKCRKLEIVSAIHEDLLGDGEDSLLFCEITRGSTDDDCDILLQFNCTTNISLNPGGGVGDGGERGIGGSTPRGGEDQLQALRRTWWRVARVQQDNAVMWCEWQQTKLAHRAPNEVLCGDFLGVERDLWWMLRDVAQCVQCVDDAH